MLGGGGGGGSNNVRVRGGLGFSADNSKSSCNH